MTKRQREESDSVSADSHISVPLAQILATFKSVDMTAFRVAFALHVWQEHQIQIIWIDPKSYLFGWCRHMSIMECNDDDIDIKPLDFDVILANMQQTSPDCKCFVAHIRASIPQPSHNFLLYFNPVDDFDFKRDIQMAAYVNDVVENIHQVLTLEGTPRMKVDRQEFQDLVTVAAANVSCNVTWDLDSFSRRTRFMTPTTPFSTKHTLKNSCSEAARPIDTVDAMVANFLRYILPDTDDDNTRAPCAVRCSLTLANIFDGEEFMIVYFETV